MGNHTRRCSRPWSSTRWPSACSASRSACTSGTSTKATRPEPAATSALASRIGKANEPGGHRDDERAGDGDQVGHGEGTQEATLEPLEEQGKAHQNQEQAEKYAGRMWNLALQHHHLEAQQDGHDRRDVDQQIEELDDIHHSLDVAVLDAYGWPPDLTDEEILERLLALNLERGIAED